MKPGMIIRKTIGAWLALITVTANSQPKTDYPIQPVAFTQVQVMDNFWAPKIKVNADVTIPYTLEQCRKTGRIDNFLVAAGKKTSDKLTEYTFDDTDLYKIIEGASYGLQVTKNPQLEKYLDTLIAIIGDAQEKDGYLYTFRTAKMQKPHEWIGTNAGKKKKTSVMNYITQAICLNRRWRITRQRVKKHCSISPLKMLICWLELLVMVKKKNFPVTRS